MCSEQFIRCIRNAPEPTPTSQPAASIHAIPMVGTRQILNRFPILKFYRGFTATIIGMIPYAGVSFLSWGYLRARFIPYGSKPTPVPDLIIGAASGVMAQTVSYPFEVVRRRMQVGGITRPDRWLRWGETMRSIWKTSGLKGFYIGLSIGYLKVVPMTAVSFTVWHAGKRVLGV
ncbi:coenzyme A transporter [Stygiomarasmius scandens]|uniref:Coenzyme A transporter n=1 Tax=Marasmiellus scandens TaxID=2682957 RepID=A0ABR1IKW2_9AGAR